MQTTMAAMKQSSEIGIILRFMENAADCQHLPVLADHLIKALNEFDLECSIQFRDSNEAFHFNCEEDSPDASLLTMCTESGRFIDIGANSIINSEFLSILISNMPISNKERYGEIKDMLARVGFRKTRRIATRSPFVASIISAQK